MPEDNRAPDYADKIAAGIVERHPLISELYTNTQMISLIPLMAAAAREGYALAFGVKS